MQNILRGFSLIIISFVGFNAKANSAFEFSAGVSFWQSTPEGSIGQTEDSALILSKESGNQYSYYFALEHPFIFLPQLKLAHTATSNSSTATIDQTFILTDTIFRVASELEVQTDYDQLDLVTYFEVFDNRTFEFDLGITFRNHFIQTEINNQDDSSEFDSKDVSDIQLLGYMASRINLPLLNVGTFVEASVLNSENYDIQAGINYNIFNTMFAKTYLQLGVRKQKIEFSNLDGLYTNVNWQEVFLGLNARF